MADKKNIVILGSSYAGLSVAHYLLRHAIPKLPSSSSYTVVLVSPSKTWYLRPASPRALITDDAFPQEDLFKPIEPLFTRYPKENFRFVHGKATKWDTDARSVVIDLSDGTNGQETVSYHSLVVATGSGTPSPLMGIHDGDAELKKQWASFRTGLASAKHIVIAGGGPTGVETAAELGEHLNGKPGWFAGKLKDPKVKITVVAGNRLIPVLRPALADKAEPMLAKLGVSVLTGTKVQGVSPPDAGTKTNVATKTTVTLSDGKTLDADLYIPSTGYIPSTTFVPSSLLGADGRIKTDSATLRVPDAGDRVYALGDCSDYARQAVHLLLQAIPIAGNTIKRDLFLAEGLADKAPVEKHFKEDTGETQLVPIGSSTGFGAFNGYSLPGFLVSQIKGKHYWLNTAPKLWTGDQWAKEA
ncbi:pyridine nucleotide-disulfide oxidoreductase domain-containing protein [Sarocladium implicatum]|nr:pyridine nucleotide-disulfide oxidoreductase domain-containing protein [Sarocladium implicatum]